MKVQQKPLSLTGGLTEARLTYEKRWGKPLPTLVDIRPHMKLILADGSSTTLRPRPSELLVTLMAMAQLPNETTIITFVGSAGTCGEYAKHWGIGRWSLPTNREWMEFYPKELHKLNLSFSPPKEIVPIVCQKRRDDILNLWECIGPRLDTPGASRPKDTFQVERFEDRVKGVVLGKCVPLDPFSELGIFPCPACSLDANDPVYHSLRWGKVGKEFVITHRGPERQIVQCKGARAFLGKKGLTDATVNYLTFATGFRASGVVVYKLLAKALGRKRRSVGLLVRDYREARGTLKEIIETWSRLVWVTTHVSVADSVSYSDFKVWIKEKPWEMVSFINKFPIISQGDRIELTV